MDKKDILVEFITQEIVTKFAQDKGAEIPHAMNEFYSSDTFEKLHDYETGLYLEGTDYIYDLFIEEKCLFV
jgi:hypothetical protein